MNGKLLNFVYFASLFWKNEVLIYVNGYLIQKSYKKESMIIKLIVLANLKNIKNKHKILGVSRLIKEDYLLLDFCDLLK